MVIQDTGYILAHVCVALYRFRKSVSVRGYSILPVYRPTERDDCDEDRRVSTRPDNHIAGHNSRGVQRGKVRGIPSDAVALHGGGSGLQRSYSLRRDVFRQTDIYQYGQRRGVAGSVLQ